MKKILLTTCFLLVTSTCSAQWGYWYYQPMPAPVIVQPAPLTYTPVLYRTRTRPLLNILNGYDPWTPNYSYGWMATPYSAENSK